MFCSGWHRNVQICKTHVQSVQSSFFAHKADCFEAFALPRPCLNSPMSKERGTLEFPFVYYRVRSNWKKKVGNALLCTCFIFHSTKERTRRKTGETFSGGEWGRRAVGCRFYKTPIRLTDTIFFGLNKLAILMKPHLYTVQSKIVLKIFPSPANNNMTLG